jgi:hypothetical protein
VTVRRRSHFGTEIRYFELLCKREYMPDIQHVLFLSELTLRTVILMLAKLWNALQVLHKSLWPCLWLCVFPMGKNWKDTYHRSHWYACKQIVLVLTDLCWYVLQIFLMCFKHPYRWQCIPDLGSMVPLSTRQYIVFCGNYACPSLWKAE